ncbi:Pharynx and intestine in excess protein 1, variant 2 [Stylosanthes scabra]|uniref:Pharynx and intestine in excess protein 1, variant 2 n=1 Tax=Stylosanthes scabra TaxID=79078 RepID=A0ABU6V9N5_9FABA|nr:Pharynx and intestine in excess protein 1, variant 2 [Stylosanthes scabra]
MRWKLKLMKMKNLLYMKWDADFATEAYRQQVETLAQHQLMEELEYEAKQKAEAEEENCNSKKTPGDSKPKSKKKPKKAKFKSLKKGSLTSGTRSVKEEPQAEPMTIDDDVISSLALVSPNSSMQKKRKNPKFTSDGEEEKRSKKSKKSKRDLPDVFASDLDSNMQDENTEALVENEQKTASRNKMGGKISITPMPVKWILMIKPEKMKKGNLWSKDCIPPADTWLPQEDAVLCAVVHEYGSNWSLVSETLYGMTAGGAYRGRYRHPVHCCERFRELFQKYVLYSVDGTNNEKINNAGSGKALLKVTEDNIRMLLDVASEQPNRELLLQKHFYALLSSVWKLKSHVDWRQNPSATSNGLCFDKGFFGSIGQNSQNSLKKSSERITYGNLVQCKKLVASALDDTRVTQESDQTLLSNRSEDIPMQVSTDQMDITLEFQKEESDALPSFPSVINLSIQGTEPLPSVDKQTGEDDHFRAFTSISENRFREAARACEEDSSAWASSVFPTNDTRSKPGSRIQSSGKQKPSNTDTGKPSKSKSKRAFTDPSETHHQQTDPSFHAMPSLKDLGIDLNASSTMDEIGVDDLPSSSLPSSLDLENSFDETESLGAVPHDYVAGLISDLDDCTTFPDFSDIR